MSITSLIIFRLWCTKLSSSGDWLMMVHSITAVFNGLRGTYKNLAAAQNALPIHFYLEWGGAHLLLGRINLTQYKFDWTLTRGMVELCSQSARGHCVYLYSQELQGEITQDWEREGFCVAAGSAGQLWRLKLLIRNCLINKFMDCCC